MSTEKRKKQLRESQQTFRVNKKARINNLVALIKELLKELENYKD